MGFAAVGEIGRTAGAGVLAGVAASVGATTAASGPGSGWAGAIEAVVAAPAGVAIEAGVTGGLVICVAVTGIGDCCGAVAMAAKVGAGRLSHRRRDLGRGDL